MKAGYVLVMMVGLAGCGSMPALFKPQERANVEPQAEQVTPQARPEGITSSAPPPAAGARTAEQFDTTSAAERAEAAAAPAAPAGETKLGETVVSLGDPTQPGFWVETPLVSAATKGRVFYPATGKSAQVDLLPSDTGSRISLAAMRLLEAPLTDLPTIEVYSGG